MITYGVTGICVCTYILNNFHCVYSQIIILFSLCITGNTHFKKGRYDEAINWYNKAIAACPEEFANDLSTFYQNRAAAYEQLKKWSAVIKDCTKALEFNSKYEKVIFSISYICYVFKCIFFVQALYRRAKAYEATKDLENCLDDITAVCLMQGFKNQSALLMADRVLRELGKMHAAEAMKTRKIRLASKQFIKTYFMSFSEDPVYKLLMDTSKLIGEGDVKGFLRAKLAFASENYEDIIPACTEEIGGSEAQSQYIAEALSLRASFSLLSGSQKDALEDLKTLIESDIADVKVKVNSLIKRASLYMQMEDTDNCLKDFEAAAKLGPEISGSVSFTTSLFNEYTIRA